MGTMLNHLPIVSASAPDISAGCSYSTWERHR